MNIMISINRAYVGYACVMLMSLKQHHKNILLSVYILHNELTEEDFLLMDETIGPEGIELIPVFIPEGAVKEFKIGNWPEAAAYRLLVADLFGGRVDRILHLDVDILIMGDISELYNAPFEDNYMVGCEDFLVEEDRLRKCREFGRKENASFFNSGVLVFNVPKLVADGFYYSLYADIIQRYSAIRIEYPDQDLLNLLFGDKIKYMDRIRYNYAPFFYKLNDREHFYDSAEEIERNCRIVHMIRGSKPWENMVRMAADELWWAYAEHTRFYMDMKIKHVQAMLHKEQKMNMLIRKKIDEIVQENEAQEEIPKMEAMLSALLEREFEITDQLNNLIVK